MTLTANVTITKSDINAGVAIRILCSSVGVAGSKNNNSTPNTSTQERVEVQTQSRDNMLITLRNVMLSNKVACLSWDDILKLYKHKYTGTDVVTLNIKYQNDSDGSGENLFVYDSSDLVEQDIKVVLKSFNISFDAGASKNASLPVGTLVFEETE